MTAKALASAVPRSPLTVRLFRDADPANDKPLAPIEIEELTLSSNDAIKVSAAANGGWAAIVEAK